MSMWYEGRICLQPEVLVLHSLITNYLSKINSQLKLDVETVLLNNCYNQGFKNGPLS